MYPHPLPQVWMSYREVFRAFRLAAVPVAIAVAAPVVA